MTLVLMMITFVLCIVQVTLLHLSRVALPGYWPMCFIPRGQGGSLDWLGEEIGVAGPNLYSIFQEMVLEGPVLLPQYVTVTRGDDTKVALGPSLTQPCTTYALPMSLVFVTIIRGSFLGFPLHCGIQQI